MKVKDVLLSLSMSHIMTTLPIWEVRDNMWLIEIMAAIICWELIIKIEELAIKIKKFWQKKKRAREVAASRQAHRKLNLYQL